MGWFTRKKENISRDSKKTDLPDGQWRKCEECGEIIHTKQLEVNLWCCQKCNYHFRIGSKEYISILFDEGTFKELDKKMKSGDPLHFSDTKKYKDRFVEIINKGLESKGDSLRIYIPDLRSIFNSKKQEIVSQDHHSKEKSGTIIKITSIGLERNEEMIAGCKARVITAG